MLELHRATADDLTDPVLESLTRMIGGIVDGPAHDACGLRLLLEQAQTAGIEHLTLDLCEGNERAQRLYASEGFREYGRLPDFVAPGDGTRCGKIFRVRSFA